MIDWSSAETHVLLNPRLPEPERKRLEALTPPLRGHILLATSGSTGPLKLVALSKEAFLASAAAVNKRLDAKAADIWCCVLPTFHVGGLGIYARAHQSGSRVMAMPWEPRTFATTEATLASLVPAQVHDLVAAGLQPPRNIRAVLVGGGAFDPQLTLKAQALGWPVLSSYGMTECCSTVSISEILLSHLDARREEDGRLAFRGDSLLSGYVTESGYVDPKIDGWFISDDVGEVDGRRLRVHGRRGDFIKIGGESVDLMRLDRILDSLRGSVDAALLAAADERLGSVIHLAVVGEPKNIVEAFSGRVAPYERIRKVHRVRSIPRSSLGKLLRNELLSEVIAEEREDGESIEQPERDGQ
jgi:O-succinylbenzoic acid--CoA ligase